MNLSFLRLRNFRNYSDLTCRFSSQGIHVLHGKNAQGKTNLIEAIYYLSHLRSFRTQNQAQMITHGQSFFHMDARIGTMRRKEDLKVVLMPEKKHLYRWNEPVKKYSDFIGILNAVLFCPDDLMLFQQSPKMRRRFIDMELIKLSRVYTFTLNRYQKLLRQRNAILKNDRFDPILLQTLTNQMIKDQVVILSQREQYLKELMEKTQKFYHFFSKEKEEIDAKYITFVPMDENLEDSIRQAYQKHEKRDRLTHQTQVGIHKDDIDFHMNGISIKDIASQGQKRSLVLSMKLALCQIIYEKQKEYPVLLLDDVFSELDVSRSRQLISILPETMQVFISSTDKLDRSLFQNKDVRYYEIIQGHCKEESR